MQQVKNEIADRCRRIHGLRCYAEMPAKPDTPSMAVQAPTQWRYNETFDGDWTIGVRVWLYTNPTDPMRSQQMLDSWLAPRGSRSVVAQLHGEDVTPGVIASLRVIGGNQPYGVVNFEGGTSAFAAALEAEVIVCYDVEE
jgi:hypothetical protein